MRAYAGGMSKAASILGMSPHTFEHVTDLAGLGLLGAIPAYHIYKHLSGDDSPPDPMLDAGLDLTGLAVLGAAPIMSLLKKR